MAPLGDPPQNQSFERLSEPVFFDISSRYFGGEYFGIVWGATPPRTTQTDPRKSIF